jgi:hypothetical protein
MGQLLKIKGVDSRLNVNFLDSTSVQFTPTTVQVPNLTLTHTKRMPVHTVTRPYEGFRHPDWIAPESTVRGRENDSLVRPGYIHLQIPSFPVVPEFSGDLLCEKMMQ